MKNNEVCKEAIKTYSDAIKEISRQTRSMIYQALPQVAEVVWTKQKTVGTGTDLGKNTEQFCWLMPTKNHVTLGFNYRTELPNLKKLQEGTDKLYRLHKVKDVEDLSNPGSNELLKYTTTYRVPPIK